MHVKEWNVRLNRTGDTSQEIEEKKTNLATNIIVDPVGMKTIGE